MDGRTNGWIRNEWMYKRMTFVEKNFTRPAERFTHTDGNTSGYQVIKYSTRWFGIQSAEEKLS